MRIVHLILTHRFAGSERYAIELANAQCERHEVTMVLHRRAGEIRPDALAHRLDRRVRIEWVSGWRLWAIRQARRRVEALAPDVAHAHLSGGCKALKGLRTPSLRVATLHIHFKPQQHAHLDALVALTPSQLDAIPSALRRRTVQIDNWTAAEPVDRALGWAQRRAWGLPDDAWLLGALGRVETSKGMALLTEAVKPLLGLPGFRMVIVGHGRDFDAIRRQADPRILMLGFQEQPQLCFSAFDAYVNAAFSEPFGLVFLEAMAQGLPIVATATEGAQHLGPRHGWTLVPVGQADALTAALRAQYAARPPRQSYDLSRYALAARAAELEHFYGEQLALQAPSHG